MGNSKEIHYYDLDDLSIRKLTINAPFTPKLKHV